MIFLLKHALYLSCLVKMPMCGRDGVDGWGFVVCGMGLGGVVKSFIRSVMLALSCFRV